MNRKFLAAIIVLGVSLMAISTALIIPVTAQNASNQDNVIQQPFYRQSHDLDVIIFRTIDTNVVCSDTKVKPPIVEWIPNHSHKKIIYDWSNSQLIGDRNDPHGYLHGDISSGVRHTDFHIVNARVDGPGKYFTMIVSIDDRFNFICSGGDNLFTMDVVGKCDGTMFEGISREPGGFNATVAGTFSVTCIP